MPGFLLSWEFWFFLPGANFSAEGKLYQGGISTRQISTSHWDNGDELDVVCCKEGHHWLVLTPIVEDSGLLSKVDGKKFR